MHMTQEMKVTINGKPYAASPGQTILEIVRAYDIDDIPTLCWDPKLPPYGSCYLCVVEVEGLEKLVPSCSSPAADGMVIHTDNERIRQSRKTALELLLSNHYADCLGPCTQTCPAGVDVQGYIALIAMGRNRDAVKLIKEKNPLPLVCGRVCVRECEAACRRNRVDSAVGIDYLKRYASDIDIEDPWTPVLPPRNGKKVAVIGGGPAGLTCAYFLTTRGYTVTIFERSPHLGGMLRYGIPEYRLPKEMLDREIGWITDLGVEVRKNVKLGVDFDMKELRDKYDAVFLAMGAQNAKGMGIAGEEATEGIVGGVEFLRQLQMEDVPQLKGKDVVVVGGGNTAIDAARSALRLGAKKVTILYRRTKKEMPAHEMEIDAALEEGVEIIYLSAPTAIVSVDGRLDALTCIMMELGKPDASGRRSPVPKEGSEYNLKCDVAVSAIGQDIDLGTICSDGQIKTTRWKGIATDDKTLITSVPGVFAGGDVVTGPAVAIDAIAHGRQAAEAIDNYINKGKAETTSTGFISRKDSFGEVPDGEFLPMLKIARERMKELPPEERTKTFAEVELGFTEEQALNESSRCLECGCTELFDCALRKYATDFGVDISRFLGDVRQYKVDNNHPFISLDPNKCIACGRCVRTCSEILKISALGFVYRGFKSVVKPSMEKKLLQTNCISCGNCIAACPTGAITEKLPFKKPGPWESRKVETVCSYCSMGCNMSYKIFYDQCFTVENVNGGSHNKGYLCSMGRFGYRYMLDSGRLLKPMIKKKGRHIEASWDEALNNAVDKIKSVLETYGPNSVAVFASPRMTNEELYALQKFARIGLKTNNIGSFSNLMNNVEQDCLDDMLGLTVSTTTMDDLKKADVILVMNANLSEGNLLADLKIKSAQKRGSRIITINASETPLNKFADLWIDPKRGTNTALIQGICKSIVDKGLEDKGFVGNRTEGYNAFKELLSKFSIEEVAGMTGVEAVKLEELYDLVSKPDINLIVFYSIDSVWEKSKNDLQALGNLMMLTGRIGKPGNGLIILRDFSNSQGLIDMGVDSKFLPGFIRTKEKKRIDDLGSKWGTDLKMVFKPVDLVGTLDNDRIKALLIFGENPLHDVSNLKFTSGVEFMLVVDHFMTETGLEADIVLPAAMPVETSGSYTTCDRRVQRFAKVFEPKTGKENWQIICELARRYGSDLHFSSVDQIFSEIGEVVTSYSSLTDDGFWGKDFLVKKFATKTGKGQFSNIEVDLNPINAEKIPYLFSDQYYDMKIKAKITP
jgi:formate dehydrogenase major subunit